MVFNVFGSSSEMVYLNSRGYLLYYTSGKKRGKYLNRLLSWLEPWSPRSQRNNITIIPRPILLLCYTSQIRIFFLSSFGWFVRCYLEHNSMEWTDRGEDDQGTDLGHCWSREVPCHNQCVLQGCCRSTPCLWYNKAENFRQCPEVASRTQRSCWFQHRHHDGW